MSKKIETNNTGKNVSSAKAAVVKAKAVKATATKDKNISEKIAKPAKKVVAPVVEKKVSPAKGTKVGHDATCTSPKCRGNCAKYATVVEDKKVVAPVVEKAKPVKLDAMCNAFKLEVAAKYPKAVFDGTDKAYFRVGQIPKKSAAFWATWGKKFGLIADGFDKDGSYCYIVKVADKKADKKVVAPVVVDKAVPKKKVAKPGNATKPVKQVVAVVATPSFIKGQTFKLTHCADPADNGKLVVLSRIGKRQEDYFILKDAAGNLYGAGVKNIKPVVVKEKKISAPAKAKPNSAKMQEMLSNAFDLVKNPKGWKNPINTVVSKDADIDLIERAIMHFTGSMASITKVSKGYKVVAAGYHNVIGM